MCIHGVCMHTCVCLHLRNLFPLLIKQSSCLLASGWAARPICLTRHLPDTAEGGLASVSVNLNTRYRIFKAKFIFNKFTQRCLAIGSLENDHNVFKRSVLFLKVEFHVTGRRNKLRVHLRYCFLPSGLAMKEGGGLQ